MKKLLFLGIVMMGMLSSCVKDAASGTPDPQKAKEEAYNNAFVQTFGKIAPNQTWGFNKSTTTRSAQPNSNQWGTNDWDGRYLNYPKPADITPEERAKVLAVFNEKGKES
jgi:hypothetical protein